MSQCKRHCAWELRQELSFVSSHRDQPAEHTCRRLSVPVSPFLSLPSCHRILHQKLIPRFGRGPSCSNSSSSSRPDTLPSAPRFISLQPLLPTATCRSLLAPELSSLSQETPPDSHHILRNRDQRSRCRQVSRCTFCFSACLTELWFLSLSAYTPHSSLHPHTSYVTHTQLLLPLPQPQRPLPV